MSTSEDLKKQAELRRQEELRKIQERERLRKINENANVITQRDPNRDLPKDPPKKPGT